MTVVSRSRDKPDCTQAPSINRTTTHNHVFYTHTHTTSDVRGSTRCAVVKLAVTRTAEQMIEQRTRKYVANDGPADATTRHDVSFVVPPQMQSAQAHPLRKCLLIPAFTLKLFSRPRIAHESSHPSFRRLCWRRCPSAAGLEKHIGHHLLGRSDRRANDSDSYTPRVPTHYTHAHSHTRLCPHSSTMCARVLHTLR